MVRPKTETVGSYIRNGDAGGCDIERRWACRYPGCTATGRFSHLKPITAIVDDFHRHFREAHDKASADDLLVDVPA